MPQRRPHTVPIRLSDDAVAWLRVTAEEHGLTVSDVIREALSYASVNEAAFRSRLQSRAAEF